MRIPTVCLASIALLLCASTAGALTLAAGSKMPARRLAGRVLSAVSDPASRTTLVTLGDAAGNEVARFTAPGAVDGRVRWVIDGIPVFRVGDEVEVGLTAQATLALDDGAQVPTSEAVAGEAVSAVTDLQPSFGGAVPDDPPVVTVVGSGFGASQLDSKVSFLGLFARVDAEVVSWSDDTIVCRVPHPGLLGSPQVLSGPVKVWTAANGWSDGDPFAGGSNFSVLYQWAGDFWPTARLPIRFWVNPKNSPYGEQFAAFARQASAQWNVAGSYAHFVYGGLTNAEGTNNESPITPKDGRNTVMWSSHWRFDPNVLAFTWSAIDTVTFERKEVELEINGTRPWTIDPEEEPSKYDLISTLTHEFGHWLRLGHTQRVPSVMGAFASPGERRREISLGDGYGASWIHPSYGVVATPVQVDAGATVPVLVTAFDRQGTALASIPKDAIEVRVIGLAENENPSALDPPLGRTPTFTAQALKDTDADGHTTASLAGLPDGRYRLETRIEGRFVRPASIVRLGPVPPAPVHAVALSDVTPSPLGPGAHGRVRFTLPVADEVALALYDVRGRKVRTVVAGSLDAGPHDVAFETTGLDGTRLRAGVYWLRLTGRSGFQAVTSRVVVLP